MAESNEYWSMLAEQEKGLMLYDTEDANGAGGWQGDVFKSGADAQSFLDSGSNAGLLGNYLNTSSDNQVYMDGLSARDMAVSQPGGLTVDGMLSDQGGFLDQPTASAEPTASAGSRFGMDTLTKGAATVDSFFKSILGEGETQKLYASAILGGIKAIMQGSQNDDIIKYKHADREDSQAHDKELIADKNKREDEARARKNTVPGAGGRVAYKPNATQNYQVPGSANTQTYGLLRTQ